MDQKCSAVLDTTVLASAFLTPGGVAAKALDHALSDYRLILSFDSLSETSRKLLTKRKIRRSYLYTDEAVGDYVQHLLSLAGMTVRDPQPLSGIVRDPEDDMIIACAATAAADYLVSRDKDLLVLGAYGATAIVTPRSFLEVLATR
ncbi:MAG: putative toxin-antitoxin system toxin component, PIN family [Alphaproteobacteria bacterium]|nr:putative toxin-antitoxin system toxin component, PIN family [Alphaproteobacteria bacterium]